MKEVWVNSLRLSERAIVKVNRLSGGQKRDTCHVVNLRLYKFLTTKTSNRIALRLPLILVAADQPRDKTRVITKKQFNIDEDRRKVVQ